MRTVLTALRVGQARRCSDALRQQQLCAWQFENRRCLMCLAIESPLHPFHPQRAHRVMEEDTPTPESSVLVLDTNVWMDHADSKQHAAAGAVALLR